MQSSNSIPIEPRCHAPENDNSPPGPQFHCPVGRATETPSASACVLPPMVVVGGFEEFYFK